MKTLLSNSLLQKVSSIFYLIVLLQLLDAVAISNIFGASNPSIRIVVKNKTLSEVTETISDQTGYSISVDRAFLSLPVSGDFSEITPDRFYSRILRGKNSIVEFDETSKSLTVISFGNKDKNSLRTFSSNPKNDIDLGISLSDLDALHKMQLETAIPDSKDTPIMGSTITLNELDQLNREQMSSDISTDPDQEVVMGANMTIYDLNAMHKNLGEESEIQHNLNDDLILGIEMTLESLNMMHTQFQNETSSLVNDQSLMLGTDMTIGELNRVINP